jgi:hypothetical protein
MEYMESKMQDYMEAGMNEHDELCERLNPPMDWSIPEWKVKDKAHNWRNYVSEDLKINWLNLSGRIRLILAANFKDISDREEWD